MQLVLWISKHVVMDMQSIIAVGPINYPGGISYLLTLHLVFFFFFFGVSFFVVVFACNLLLAVLLHHPYSMPIKLLKVVGAWSLS